jgi:hypothetical protein
MARIVPSQEVCMRASIGTFMLVGIVLAGSSFAACGGTTVGTGGAATTSETTTTTSTGTGGTSTGTGGAGDGGGLPVGKCRDAEDCKGGEQCLPPGTTPGCGTCIDPPNPCNADADCGAMGAICVPAQCACQGEKTCQPGCTSSSTCGVGETCEPDYHCRPSICAQQIDCPVNFLCPPTLNSRCERRTCKVDPECDVGYCVEGFCFDVPGNCTPPVP